MIKKIVFKLSPQLTAVQELIGLINKEGYIMNEAVVSLKFSLQHSEIDIIYMFNHMYHVLQSR